MDWWRDLNKRAAEWADPKPWRGWADLPPGPERDAKHALFVEEYSKFEAATELAVGPEIAESRARRAAEVRRVQMAAWGLPERLWPVLEHPEPTDAMQAIGRWLNATGWILVLGGGPGTGKTVAAAVACLALKGRMVTAAEALDRLFDREFWSQLEHRDLVALDDLGTEVASGDAREHWLGRWRTLLDARYRSGKRLLVTTNLDRATFLRRYVDGDNGRTADRMRDGGVYSPVAGASMRFSEAES